MYFIVLVSIMNNCYKQLIIVFLYLKKKKKVCIMVFFLMAHQIFRNILGLVPETQLFYTIKAALMRYYSPAHGMMVKKL